jgi:hypothetical protein
MRRTLLIVTFLLAILPRAGGVAESPPERRVVVITLDGFRWQEMFGGAQREYFKRSKPDEVPAAEKRFWRDGAAERREILMPFMWKTVAAKGQILGDPEKQSRVHLSNGLWFSYPGYNEMLAGVADPRIDSNDKVPNPNVTVLEWLNGRPAFKGRVAAFGSWDVLPSIVNSARSGIPVGTGFTPVPAPRTDRERAINELATDLPAYWSYGPFDAPIVYAALEAMRASSPRVIYIMLGEGDEWAHAGRYDLYLDATFRADRFIQRVWETVQSLPDYKDRTSVLVTTDHGRGATVNDWNDHGRKVPAAETTWMAGIGPAVAPLGVRSGVTVTTAQFAATIAAAVGEDFRAAIPAAAPPVPGLVK